MKGDVSLYNFPVTLHSNLSCLRNAKLLWRGLLPVCVAFGDEGCTEHYNRQLMCSVRSCTGVADQCLRLQRNAATDSYQTIQPDSFGRQA